MPYITSSLVVIVISILIETVLPYTHNYNTYPYRKVYTERIKIKQGFIQGVVVNPEQNANLPPVEHYLGIPYAAPPVGDLRFMPPRDAPSWEDAKYADNFGPVCPQMFPDLNTFAPKRKEEFLRLKDYLLNESEDCLYLNIYVSHEGKSNRMEQFPVMVFIHGESFEWNSGNPYDGSVLAAYGKVVVVTFNFRLGILGFLKTGTGDDSKSNFGLVDQIAALVWVRENIAAFGGDPDSVTLMGHGTGAVCASLLTLSPMVLPGNVPLFHRAILMGGTALSDWALADNPKEVTYQVARKLDCPIDDDFEACLREKHIDEIVDVNVFSRPYATRFGPVVDSRIVPYEPLKSMTNFSGIFRRFELMYGVTEMESVHSLGPIFFTYGMLKKERDQELRNYLRFTCQTRPEACVTSILSAYAANINVMDDEAYSSAGSSTAGQVRDSLLDILSDARTVAPIVKMGKFHSEVNQLSYFYVFKHKTTSKEYLRDKTSTGDELPYMFGVPLEGTSFHFVDNYTKEERLFSELIMTYICNFAYRGNPNYPRTNEYYTHSDIDWSKFDVDWPEYDGKRQRNLQLDIPPKVLNNYRENEVQFWNKEFPKFLEESRKQNDPFSSDLPVTAPPRKPFKGTAPFIFRPTKNNREEQKKKVYGIVVNTSVEHADKNTPVIGTVISSQSEMERANAMNIIVISGSLFLFANFILFTALYYKCYKLKKNRVGEIIDNEADGDTESAEKKNNFEENQAFVANGCGLMNMISKSSKSDDVYEAVRLGGQQSPKYSLARQLSNSTIDAHTKVRDWITQEINHRCSPKVVRKLRQTNDDQKVSSANNRGDEMVSLKNDHLVDNDSTLGKSSTRPVSPATSPMDSSGTIKPILVKQTSLPNHPKKRRDKVSVAIDATPSGRGPSVLAQQPIELTKSLDFGMSETPLRRSITLDDFSPKTIDAKPSLTKSESNLRTYGHLRKPTLVKIDHSHSRSDPVQDTYTTNNSRKLKTFDPRSDVNVTSCDEIVTRPLSPEESLLTIKRRNFPKVLPDYPDKEALAQKRRSMPAANLSIPVNDLRNKMRIPPVPPARTTSTLGRKPQNNPSVDYLVCTSAPVLLEEGSSSPEPELTYNNLYVGPLIPKKTQGELLDTNPIYSSLSALKKLPASKADKVGPVAIVTTDRGQPLRKPEPKTVIRPKMVRQISDPKSRNIPRVTATDNLPGHHPVPCKTERGKETKNDEVSRPTMIPVLQRSQNIGSKQSSESETSPSEESDTGTVVKLVKDGVKPSVP